MVPTFLLSGSCVSSLSLIFSSSSMSLQISSYTAASVTSSKLLSPNFAFFSAKEFLRETKVSYHSLIFWLNNQSLIKESSSRINSGSLTRYDALTFYFFYIESKFSFALGKLQYFEKSPQFNFANIMYRISNSKVCASRWRSGRWKIPDNVGPRTWQI